MTKIPVLVNAWGWLAGIDPAVPWFLIPLLAWLVNLAVRTWAPKLWERLASLGPSGVTAGKAFEALPAVAFGAAFSALSGHSDPRGLMHAALAGLIAPVWHEALKQFVPGYLGGAFPAAGGATPPLDSTPAAKGGTVSLLLLVILLPGCAGSLQAAKLDGAPARSTALKAAPDAVAVTTRCQALDSSRTTWGGIAKVSAALAGGSGIASIPLDDGKRDEHRLKLGFEVGAVAFAAAAAGAFYVAEAKGETWARECSGQ